MTTQTLNDIQPVSASASGENSHILACDVIGQRRYYAVCLKLINEKKPSQALQSIYSECFSAINKRTCPAMKMQKEETLAGLALYFQERKTEFSSIPVPTLKVSKRSQKPVEAPKVKKENNGLGFSAPSYADVLNSVIEKEQQEKKPEVKPAPVEKVAMKPNESLLDLAKRLMAQKSD
jgi:hypothetical protein